VAQQPVEFLLAIPVDQNILGTTTKVILRRAVKGIVPEAVLTRRDKVEFTSPESCWFRGLL